MKMNTVIITAIAVSVFTGCASTKTIVLKSYTPKNESKISFSVNHNPGMSIPANQYQLIKSQIRENLDKSGVLASNTDTAQYSAVVNLNTFRIRHNATRLTAGVFAGCDNINSIVVVTDNSTHKKVGSSQISIKECAAWGVASQVIKKYTDGVVAYLSKR